MAPLKTSESKITPLTGLYARSDKTIDIDAYLTEQEFKLQRWMVIAKEYSLDWTKLKQGYQRLADHIKD